MNPPRVIKIAIATVLSLGSLCAHSGEYRIKVLSPLNASKNSFGKVVGPKGFVLGEAEVAGRCPVTQWLSCLLDGFADTQPRSVAWESGGGNPVALPCLDTRMATVNTWDKPCEALAVNKQGAMVGRSYFGSDARWMQKPVLWPKLGAQPIDLTPLMQGLPAYVSARAVGINNMGWILGRARSETNRAEYAFVLRDGMATLLNASGATSVQAVAINDTMAVGQGLYDMGGRSGVIIWTLGGPSATLRSVDGTENQVYAQGLSTAGHVAGYYWAPGSGEGNKAYVWYQGHAQALPTASGFSSIANDVNASGQAVGSHCAAGQDIHGCRATLWINGVRLDLNTMTTPPSGFTLVDAKSIDDEGQVTGWMIDAMGLFRGFVLTPRL